MVGVEFSVLSIRSMLEPTHSRLEILRREIAAWEKERNEKQATVDWRFTTPDARIKLKRLYPS